MQTALNLLQSYWWILALLLCLLFYKFILRVFFGMIMVPEDSIGMVIKKFVLFGTDNRLPEGRIIATKGEAGFQAQTLAPGLHWGKWIWQYSIQMQVNLVIEAGKIKAIGDATAEAYEKQKKAIGADNLTKMRIIETIGKDKIQLVPNPQILIVGNGGEGSGALEGLLGFKLAESMRSGLLNADKNPIEDMK